MFVICKRHAKTAVLYLWPYYPQSRPMHGGTVPDRTALNFKLYGHRENLVAALVRKVADKCKADELVALGTSGTKRSRLQALLSSRIRISSQSKRKPRHGGARTRRVSISAERKRVHVNRDGPKADRILLVDDVAASGKTLHIYARILAPHSRHKIERLVVGHSKPTGKDRTFARFRIPDADVRAEDPYEQRRERARKQQADQAAAGRDIGEIPRIRNRRRRRRAEKSLRVFAETYFSEAFYLKWSDDHLRVLKRIENVIRKGRTLAQAMPRGSGKTTIAEVACLWAILYGLAHFVSIIGVNATKGEEILDSISQELETNDLLAEDFPEAIYPILRLERIRNRALGQTYKKTPTRIRITKRKIILATIGATRDFPDGAPCTAAIITATGLEAGNIRGQRHKITRKGRPRVLRPDLVLIDDPQTRETAISVAQNRFREDLISGDVLGMAGPDKAIAAVLNVTVIAGDDMADRMLNRQRHPEWQGIRTKLLYAFPKRDDLWDQYARILTDALREGDPIAPATTFYRKNRREMDAGARVAWPARFRKGHGEISALQFAMNLYIIDPVAFAAEYQGEPLSDAGDEIEPLTSEQIQTKTNGLELAQIPRECELVTMFVDVHDRVLYYVVAAWTMEFSGYIIDYGTWPRQNRRWFTLREARKTLRDVTSKAGRDGAIVAGLEALFNKYLAKVYERDDGSEIHIARLLVDVGYATGPVRQAIRLSPHRARILPAIGVGIGASNKPMREYRKQKGDFLGLHWRIPSARGTKALRAVHVDTNYWKSFIHSAIKTPLGDRGSLSLYGREPGEHRLYADHVAAEYAVTTHGRGRSVQEWKLRPGAPDNHLLDGTVGTAVAACLHGARILGKPKRLKAAADPGGKPDDNGNGKRRRRRGVSYMKI